MVASEEIAAFLFQNIIMIISLITSGALFTRWVIKVNGKRMDKLEKNLLGPDKDGRAGKGGLLDEIRNEGHRYADSIVSKNTIKIDYIQKSVDRIEASINKMLIDDFKDNH